MTKSTFDEQANQLDGSLEAEVEPGTDYSIGYGRPPTSTQFKKGQSGNPKGRPKRKSGTASGSVKQILTAFLGRPVTVRDGEKVTQVTLFEAVMRAFVAKAAHGDLGAVRTMLNQLAWLDPTPEVECGYAMFPRRSETHEEFEARCERLPNYLVRSRTPEEARAYLKSKGIPQAPVDVWLSGQEEELLVIEVPEHLRQSGS